MSVARVLAAGLAIAALGSYLHDANAKFGASTVATLRAVTNHWHRWHAESFEFFKSLIPKSIVDLADVGHDKGLLETPAWIVLAAAGVVLWLIGAVRRRRRQTAESQAGHEAPIEGRRAAAQSEQAPQSELRIALRSCRAAFLGVGLFSGVSNILMLTGAFYMLEIYDRVLVSRNIPTLVALSILAGVLYLAHGLIDLVRGRLLVRIGASLDEAMSARVYNACVKLPLKAGQRSDGLQPLRDLESIRAFLSGLGPTALFDVPWMPLYLLIIFAFHPLLGMTALVGALVLITLTAFTELRTRTPTQNATKAAAMRSRLAEASQRNTEVLTAMGFASHLEARWQAANAAHMTQQQKVSDVAGGIGAFSKVVRMLLQSAMLGLGAYLVIQQQVTAGIIIAGSILGTRALAPADLAIAHWKGFVVARQAWQRLDKLLKLMPEEGVPLTLPEPKSSLAVEGVALAPPGSKQVVVQDVTLMLTSGQGLGILGPSASGKSSLARALVGVWQPARGRVRLDGASLDQWSGTELGRHIGYLPQDVELFAGTIAENIARFDPTATDADVVAAAQAAFVHDLIVALPNGYGTEVGEAGSGLSAGQQQRIALARALYGNPFLVVLDEPNSNLDQEGEVALTQAIQGVRNRGGIVIVIAHRASVLTALDMVLIMKGGRAQAFGPKEEVLSKAVRPNPPPMPLRMIPHPGQSQT